MIAHLFEELVVGLFGGADFDGLHHFAGRDDDAAEDFRGRAKHGGVGEVYDGDSLARARHMGLAPPSPKILL